MKRIGLGAFALGVATLCIGCRSEAYLNAIFARASTLSASPEYAIGSGDRITIRVLGQSEFSITDSVRPDGKVSFPEHGDIHVGGKTTAAVRVELEEAFKQTLGLKNPRVYVAVNDFDSKYVTVLGEVVRPGRYRYRGDMRVTDLLGTAIGVNNSGAPNRALLFREIDGATKVYHVHLNDYFEKADFTTDFYLRPGDVVFVPKHGFAIVADGIRKVMSPITAITESVGLGARTVDLFVPVSPE